MTVSAISLVIPVWTLYLYRCSHRVLYCFVVELINWWWWWNWWSRPTRYRMDLTDQLLACRSSKRLSRLRQCNGEQSRGRWAAATLRPAGPVSATVQRDTQATQLAPTDRQDAGATTHGRTALSPRLPHLSHIWSHCTGYDSASNILLTIFRPFNAGNSFSPIRYVAKYTFVSNFWRFGKLYIFGNLRNYWTWKQCLHFCLDCVNVFSRPY